MGSVGRSPPGRRNSKTTIHSGVMATTSAARPDGTNCSAQDTAPLPIVSRSAPTIAVLIHWRRVGFARSRIAAQA
jgi:hypothetical protein